jgi:hypothetical protein
MADPLSILGLTIAIFDQLIKLGERTAELTSDIRAFDEVGSGQCRLLTAFKLITIRISGNSLRISNMRRDKPDL